MAEPCSQRHKRANLLEHCPAHARRELRRDYNRIVYAKNGIDARKAYDELVAKWTPLAPAVVRSLEEAGNQLLTFYEFPRAMWKSIRNDQCSGESQPRVFDAGRKPKRRSPARSPRSLCCLGLSPLARFNYDASTATNV